MFSHRTVYLWELAKLTTLLFFSRIFPSSSSHKYSLHVTSFLWWPRIYFGLPINQGVCRLQERLCTRFPSLKAASQPARANKVKSPETKRRFYILPIVRQHFAHTRLGFFLVGTLPNYQSGQNIFGRFRDADMRWKKGINLATLRSTSYSWEEKPP